MSFTKPESDYDKWASNFSDEVKADESTEPDH